MEWRQEWKAMVAIAAVFIACFYLPVGQPRFDNAVMESLHLVRWYAQAHVLLCLVPAFFIAGAIAVFIRQGAVMKYLGAHAPKPLAYGVASVSGTILAVCSCTVLPLFAGIYRMGAGLGPATAFLYSGPAINVLAVVLTARVLGLQLGLARALGAIIFSIVIGLLMHFFFRFEERERTRGTAVVPDEEAGRPLWQNGLFFGALVMILVFANWGAPEHETGFWQAIYVAKWQITILAVLLMAGVLAVWFSVPWWKLAIGGSFVALGAVLAPQQPLLPFSVGALALALIAGTGNPELRAWLDQTWGFAKQILPLLLIGVLFAGLLLGRPGEEGLIPGEWVAGLVGGNSLQANLFASVVGAFMYFATLTEIPILQGLLGNGMGQGPALALLLAGPALSLPNMLVIRSVLGTRKTLVYILLVIVMATLSGMIYGMIAG